MFSFLWLVTDRRERVESLIDRFDLRARIFMPGFVESVDPLISVSDVVVVPSLDDGQPLVVLHAQVYGKPVVATSVGSIPIMIRHEENGFLVEPGNLDQFCAIIQRLINDRELAKRIGARAYESVRKNFSEQRMIDCYRSLLVHSKEVTEKVICP